MRVEYRHKEERPIHAFGLTHLNINEFVMWAANFRFTDIFVDFEEDYAEVYHASLENALRIEFGSWLVIDPNLIESPPFRILNRDEFDRIYLCPGNSSW